MKRQNSSDLNIIVDDNSPKQDSFTFLIRAYKVLALLLAALLPLAAIGYLSFFVDPSLKFHSNAVHEIAISFATISLGFVSFAAYKTYERLRQPFQRFLTLAVLGFVLVYAPHGMLTRLANHNMILFLIFGPTSRLIASIFLFVAFLNAGGLNGKLPGGSDRWTLTILLFLLLDLFLFFIATSLTNLKPIHLKIIESTSVGFFLLSLVLAMRTRASWLSFYMVAILFFIQAGIAFLLSRPWNHMWWLAHAISAAGFFVMGYSIMTSYERANSNEMAG